MNKKLFAGLVVLLGLVIGLSAQAATKLTGYTLVANGKIYDLTDKTGYLYRSGSAVMVPVEAVCGALDFECTIVDDLSARIEDKEGNTAIIRKGVKKAQINGKYKNMRKKPAWQEGEILTADIKLFGMLGAKYKHYPAKTARKLGYEGGVVVLDTLGQGTDLPDITPQGDELPPQASQAAKTASQIVTVEYNDSTGRAALTLYQKNDGKWFKQFSPVSAYVGRNGIGKTKEGDGKTPTGTYNLTQPFGILSDPGTSLGKYTKVTKYHYWCSNSDSPYYNQMVDTRKQKDFVPVNGVDEKLSSISSYKYCIFIDYNANGIPGKGSAIFLHCKGSASTTSGCIAVDQAVMKALLKQLKPGAKIVIY